MYRVLRPSCVLFSLTCFGNFNTLFNKRLLFHHTFSESGLQRNKDIWDSAHKKFITCDLLYKQTYRQTSEYSKIKTSVPS